ncbi:hypothetical protein ACIQVE_01490 [Pseudomonas sp. NPDC098747]|uniref:hypothetical protein n=1 Tax=Pseudomonas sp. NPDC098747 TaxID=3364487 RepID=UPI00383B92D0
MFKPKRKQIQMTQKLFRFVFAMAISLGAAHASAETAPDFVHPLDFNGSNEQKNLTISTIEKRVEANLCSGPIVFCQKSTIRLTENIELHAFKALTKEKDRAAMDRIIDSQCSSTSKYCSYSLIHMLYINATQSHLDKLTWD